MSSMALSSIASFGISFLGFSGLGNSIELELQEYLGIHKSLTRCPLHCPGLFRAHKTFFSRLEKLPTICAGHTPCYIGILHQPEICLSNVLSPAHLPERHLSAELG